MVGGSTGPGLAFPVQHTGPPLAGQRVAGLCLSPSLEVTDSLLTPGQSCHVLPVPPPRVGLGPSGLLRFSQLCEQWSLFPLRSALPGMLHVVVLSLGVGEDAHAPPHPVCRQAGWARPGGKEGVQVRGAFQQSG